MGMRRPGRTKIREPALRMLGVVVLLASLVVLLATACGGSTRSTPPAEDGNRNELQNPAESGEKVLANLPEVNPPLAGSNPKIVGSQNMPTQQFVQTIGTNLNAKWRAVFEEAGYDYSNAKFLVYSRPISSTGCVRIAAPKMGPFYCPQNMTVYYPLSWRDRSGQTPRQIGDFAVATVLAHETGHHIQNLLGILGNPKLYTIQRELQADCIAGVWGRSIYEEGTLEPGDVAEGLLIMAEAADLPGTPPESYRAHGTAAQRTDSFFTGYESGQTTQCKP
jgi:predicted metalloprotease